MPWNIICNKIDTFHETCGTEHDKKGFICMFQDPNVPWNLWMGCSWEQKVVYFLVPTVPGNGIGHKRAYFLVPENRIWQKRVHLYVPRTECSMKLVNGLFPGTETGLFSCSHCSREQNRAQTGVFSCSREQNMTKKGHLHVPRTICSMKPRETRGGDPQVPWNLFPFPFPQN